uniref:Uncharacterized protein n=1 Tax=Eutreptiella gymnastica TaxID=73025 RepID=A0A7S1IIZ3_9EUGL|mmetsp:Transcript_2184/g.4188  ORF Transcript_2184/g.4188 Transcript_2184/m.4188 type:complete len:506 (+) Transcript_2184:64-1581(+)
MGSKQVRERHNFLYGSTLGSLSRVDQFASSNVDPNLTVEELRARQDSAMERLSQPRLRPTKDSEGNVQRQLPPNNRMQNKAQMENLFGPLTWVYATINLSKDEITMPTDDCSKVPPVQNSVCFKKATRSIERELKQHDVLPMDPKTSKKKALMSTASPQYALLFDMITTRRVIMSGEPHRVATELYRWVDTYFPHTIKFTFIGITDNGSTRVARDVFYKDKLNNKEDAFQKYINKCDFEAVDDNHMYTVYPENDAYVDYIIRMGLDHLKAEEQARRDRYTTPKYEPDPLPAFVQRDLDRLKQERERLKSLRTVSPAPKLRSGRSPPSSPVLGRLSPLNRSISDSTGPGRAKSPSATVASGDEPWGTTFKSQRDLQEERAKRLMERNKKLQKGRPLRTGPPKSVSSRLSLRLAGSPTSPSKALTSPQAASQVEEDPEAAAQAEFLRQAEQRFQDINQVFKKRLKASKDGVVDVPVSSTNQASQHLLQQQQLAAAMVLKRLTSTIEH